MNPSASWVLGVLVLLMSATARAQSLPDCLVVGAGQWSPRQPGSIWGQTRSLVLLQDAAPGFDASLGHADWREVRFNDRPDTTSAGAHEYDIGWAWVSPAPDSLLLLRPSMLSPGMIVRGGWKADKLRGRGVAFTDAVRFPAPRASIYAVRYHCRSAKSRAAAFNAVERLRKSDVSDTALNAIEDQRERIQIDSALHAISASIDWIPADAGIPELRARPDTLPPATRDSVLDAVIAELVIANQVRAPAVAAHTYLSPYRGFGLRDTLALHDSTWLVRVRQRYSLAGICGWSGAYPCPEGGQQQRLATSAPELLPSGLVLVTMYRYVETLHTWGAATTAVYLTRSQGRWEVLCRGVTMYDDGTR